MMDGETIVYWRQRYLVKSHYSNHSSFCNARILKAKYYLNNTDLRHAGPKRGSSLTWQSIISRLSCLKRRYIWRIGTGENVDIWYDPWIPSSLNRLIITS